jgi:hypothetical protein
MLLDLLAHVLSGVADEALRDLPRGERPAKFGYHPGIHPHGDALAVDKRAITVENNQFYLLRGSLHYGENTGMATAAVEVSLSANALTDEDNDLLLDESAELREALAALPGIVGNVYQRADTSDPERQGGELIALGLDLIPVALESLLVLIQSWRERGKEKKQVDELSGLAISVTIKSKVSEVTLHIDGTPDYALPTATAILAQLTSTEQKA